MHHSVLFASVRCLLCLGHAVVVLCIAMQWEGLGSSSSYEENWALHLARPYSFVLKGKSYVQFALHPFRVILAGCSVVWFPCLWFDRQWPVYMGGFGGWEPLTSFCRAMVLVIEPFR
jgi:hypothetical protein